jgi:peptide/nickel transport system permease protein
MSRFIVIRLLQMIAVVAIMSFVVYALIGLMPGDPIDLMISSNPHLSPADAVRLKALYGLDKPLIERYFAWARAALGGDFGYSRLYLQPVLNVLLPRLGNTAVLMGASLLCAYALALPLGILAARRPGSAVDGAVNLLAFAGISVPSFWLALMLILVFAATLGWLPAGGVATIGDGSLPDRVRHLVLPATTLTLVSMGAHLRYIRAAMIETLRQDYIRTAPKAPASSACSPATRCAMR